MAKQRSSVQKRHREHQKRQRELKKAERASLKRQRRMNRAEQDAAAPVDDTEGLLDTGGAETDAAV